MHFGIGISKCLEMGVVPVNSTAILEWGSLPASCAYWVAHFFINVVGVVKVQFSKAVCVLRGFQLEMGDRAAYIYGWVFLFFTLV